MIEKYISQSELSIQNLNDAANISINQMNPGLQFQYWQNTKAAKRAVGLISVIGLQKPRSHLTQSTNVGPLRNK